MMSLFLPLTLVLLLLSLFIKWNEAKIKGRIGEKRVSSVLSTLPDGYFPFDNIHLREGDRSTQIDHVVVSPYGIFVIETKNYKGWIYGRRRAEYWTQNIYGTKFPLRNPVRQNYAHTRALQELLGIPLNRFVQIVVFLDRAVLKGYMDERVVYLSQLREFILSHSTERLTAEEVTSFRDLIHSSDVRGTKAAKRHILYVRARVQERQRLIESRICPRCGGQLLVRQGPYSSFLGCSNYPHCRFTAPDSSH